MKLDKKIFLLIFVFLFSFSFAQTQVSVSSGGEGDIYFGRVIDPNKYVLGIGDRINVYIVREKEDPISFSLVVSPTGSVNLPLVGVIKLSGLTLTEATREISKQLIRYYPKSIISIDLVYPRKFKIYILGEVVNPGTHLLSALSTLDDLIKLSGGLKASSSVRNIQIIRGDKVITVDYLKFLKLGDINENPFMEEGDIVYVPLKKESVKILGQVISQGVYEIKKGERIRDLLKLAGGLAINADLFGAYVERQVKDKREIINIDLFKLIYENDESQNIELRDGDIFYVPAKVNRVYVLGYVKNPRSFTITAGEVGTIATLEEEEAPIREVMKVSELVGRAGGVLPNGSKRRIQIIRDGQVIKEVDLFKVLVKGDTQEEAVKLVPGDVIYVPLAEKTVRILGEVRDPGIYEVRPGEKIKDLIEMAGGFTVRADLRNITVERYITERRQIINLDLTKLYKDGDESVNILLEDGDIINIPIRSE